MLFLLAVAEEVVDEEEEEEDELSLLLWSLVAIHNLNHTLKTGYYVGLENWNNYVLEICIKYTYIRCMRYILFKLELIEHLW